MQKGELKMELNVVHVVKMYFTVVKYVNRNHGNYTKDRVKRQRKQRKRLRKLKNRRPHQHLIVLSVLQDVVSKGVTLAKNHSFFAVIVVWVHFIVAENVN